MSLNEIIKVVDYSPRPLHDEGWYSFSELYEEVKKNGVPREAFRARLSEKTKEGKLEKIYFGKNSYYRVKK